jgi:hypothetical protein
MISNQLMDRLWEDSRRLGILTQLYRENIEDWRLLKCARAFAKQVGGIRNANLVRLLTQIFHWLRTHMSEDYRRARQGLKNMSQIGKFRIGIWSSAGLSGELLRFYISLKNGSAPPQILVELYST